MTMQSTDELGLGVQVQRVRCPVPRQDAPAVFEALRAAARAGDADAVRRLLRHSLDAALDDAISLGHADVVRALVEHGAKSGRTVFMDAFR